MGGDDARRGFQYQDLYLLLRVLKEASGVMEVAWDNGEYDVINAIMGIGTKFGIEAEYLAPERTENDANTPDWDVLVLSDTKFEFSEVKSGDVAKSDRLTFWRRIRKELNNPIHGEAVFVPSLVYDPEKFDPGTKWTEINNKAKAYSGECPVKALSGNVMNSADMLHEALWEICGSDEKLSECGPKIDLLKAIAALKEFELHAFKKQELEDSVTQYLELLFSGGLSDSNRNLLLGWLNSRAISEEKTTRLFSIHELLSEVGLLKFTLSLNNGQLQEWRDLWKTAPTSFQSRINARLGNGGAFLAIDDVQPELYDSLYSKRSKKTVIRANGGAGKSTILTSITEEPGDGIESFCCGADDISESEVETLTRAIRFISALMLMRHPEKKLLVCVDGLDEATVALRKKWIHHLVRLGALSNLQLVVSVRDATWASDGFLRSQLSDWKDVELDLWPLPVVERIIKESQTTHKLERGILEILRIPIFLDIFWRTFVENHSVAVRHDKLSTSYDILYEFWHSRVINSTKRQDVGDLSLQVNNCIAFSADQIGRIPPSAEHTSTLEHLTSEGVLVKVGKIQPGYSFRHSILRDFAFSQWCLASANEDEVAGRWSSIASGLNQYGALRAIFDAMSNPNSKDEYPSLDMNRILLALSGKRGSLASDIASFLGAQVAAPILNPNSWPRDVQASLPATFASDIVGSAKLNQNLTWANYLEAWESEAPWIDTSYPLALLSYAQLIEKEVIRNPSDPVLKACAISVARALRDSTELPKFESEVEKHDRWLKMQAIITVIPLIPSSETMEWVERELPRSSRRTRSFLPEQLHHLALIDAQRTAQIYRQVVGLSPEGEEPRLNLDYWNSMMKEQALDWSLLGKDRRVSLLNRFPEAFLKVLLDLAEAIWKAKHSDTDGDERFHALFMEELEPSWSKESHDEIETSRLEIISDLIDDSPQWVYNESNAHGDPYRDCVAGVRQCLDRLLAEDPDKLADALLAIRRSRMATMQMLLFDFLITNNSSPELLKELTLDRRVLAIHGFDYYAGRSLECFWGTYSKGERDEFFKSIELLLANQHTEDDAKYLLARIKLSDVPEELAASRPNDNDEQYFPRRCETLVSYDRDFEEQYFNEQDQYIHIGEWPPEIDKEELRSFARLTSKLDDQGVLPKEKELMVERSAEALSPLMTSFLSNIHLLSDKGRLWVWGDVRKVLASYSYDAESKSIPDPELVTQCVDLALEVLRDVPDRLPGELPKGELWTGHRETSWTHALRLADEALTREPAISDSSVQSLFWGIVSQAIESNDPIIHLECLRCVRPFHWLRHPERREMLKGVFSKHNSSHVLAWSVSLLSRFDDITRASLLRKILQRSDLGEAMHLSDRIGQFIGTLSILIFSDGQRSAATEIARESIFFPERFSFLNEEAIRLRYYRSLVFGMKEQAKKIASSYPQLAGDFGTWILKIWQYAVAVRKSKSESEGLILFALHWLEKDENTGDREELHVWWNHLQPLITAVVSEGGRPDCHTLFFGFRSGKFNDLATADQMITFVSIFYERLIYRLESEPVDLAETVPDEDIYYSWLDCANYAAETIDSLNRDGLLLDETLRERSYQLLSRLASEPFRCSNAAVGLNNLRNG